MVRRLKTISRAQGRRRLRRKATRTRTRPPVRPPDPAVSPGDYRTTLSPRRTRCNSLRASDRARRRPAPIGGRDRKDRGTARCSQTARGPDETFAHYAARVVCNNYGYGDLVELAFFNIRTKRIAQIQCRELITKKLSR